MSTKETFLQKLEKYNTRTFILPTLGEEITYKKLDVIESSINESIPNFMASRVLEAMRNSINGNLNEGQKDIQIGNDDLRDLLVRATEMWSIKVITPVLTMDDIVNIPSQDRIAWFVHAIGEAQESQTEGGGVLAADKVAKFPGKAGNRGNSKRASNS